MRWSEWVSSPTLRRLTRATTLGDRGTNPSGVTGEVELDDGSTVDTDLQAYY
jgi:hypothetical protein